MWFSLLTNIDRSRYFVELREKKLLRTLIFHLCSSSSRVFLFAITKIVLFTSTTVCVLSCCLCMYTKKLTSNDSPSMIEYGKSIIRCRSTVNDISIILVSVSMSALSNLQNVVTCKKLACVCNDRLSVLQI